MIMFAIGTSLILPTLSLPSFIESALALNFANMSDNTPSNVISLIASSVITITSIAFSMTIVALVMASNQFGPRLIKNFMQNTLTQLVLGTFTSTFVFCVSVVSRTNLASASPFYAELALSICLVLAMLCIFVLIFFIHHVATSIRADTVVKQIANALMKDMGKLQCEKQGLQKTNSAIDLDTYPFSHEIVSECDGYIQAIEYKQIIDISAQHDGLIVMHYRAGQYVVPGVPIATLYIDKASTEELSLDGALVIGKERTALQDPLFAINQLVEMAVRALSPSLDDPFTAANCIDRLASAMASFTEKTLPKTSIVDEDKVIRIVSAEATFSELFERSFTQIRQASSAHGYVVMHLLNTFITLLKASKTQAYICAAVGTQLSCIKQYHQEHDIFLNDVDRARFNEHIAELERLVQACDIA
jgi:uncharacterized membrane protein